MAGKDPVRTGGMRLAGCQLTCFLTPLAANDPKTT